MNHQNFSHISSANLSQKCHENNSGFITDNPGNLTSEIIRECLHNKSTSLSFCAKRFNFRCNYEYLIQRAFNSPLAQAAIIFMSFCYSPPLFAFFLAFIHNTAQRFNFPQDFFSSFLLPLRCYFSLAPFKLTFMRCCKANKYHHNSMLFSLGGK